MSVEGRVGCGVAYYVQVVFLEKVPDCPTSWVLMC